MADTLTVGVDETPTSRPAALWAAEEAVRRDALLRLVHVREAPAYPDPAPESPLAQLAHHHADRHPALRLDTAHVTGEPRETLGELSRESDLLVIGSRGLGPLRGFLVGSVTLPTVARAECPVVLVRAEAATVTAPRTGRRRPAHVNRLAAHEPGQATIPAGETASGACSVTHRTVLAPHPRPARRRAGPWGRAGGLSRGGTG